MNETPVDIVEGSGNVFADIGLPDAEDMLLKSKLVMELRKLIDARNFSQAIAARLLGIDQLELSKLLRGQFRGYSIERLMRMLTALDQDIEIVMDRARSRARVGASRSRACPVVSKPILSRLRRRRTQIMQPERTNGTLRFRPQAPANDVD